MNSSKILLVWAMIMAAGCSTVPPTNVHQPMTARPVARSDVQPNNGSIFQVASVRPLFEDRRARYVGDTITVNITENNAASADSKTDVSRTASTTASISALDVYPFNRKPLTSLVGMNVDGSSSNTFKGAGDVENNNTFTGTITVTVIDVLPNGNLLVSGEKQVSIGQQQEFIRLSGVVDPNQILANNSIPSSRVADARVEYKASGTISEAQVMGWLARFFLSVLPF